MPTFRENMEKMRANPATACSGLPWLDDEDEDLLKEAAAKTPISAIAAAHKRTEGSILGRLKNHGWRLQQEGVPFIQICSRLNLDMDLLEKHFEKMEGRSAAPKKRTIAPEQSEMELLKEIRDLLKVLVDKVV